MSRFMVIERLPTGGRLLVPSSSAPSCSSSVSPFDSCSGATSGTASPSSRTSSSSQDSQSELVQLEVISESELQRLNNPGRSATARGVDPDNSDPCGVRWRVEEDG